MMKNDLTPEDLVSTIYLGDRAVKAICLDSWKEIVRVSVDEISRIRNPDGNWDFYNDENIVDGQIVFAGVSEMRIDPPGAIPNDAIQRFSVRRLDGSKFSAVIQAVAMKSNGDGAIATITLVASDLYLVDPRHPDTQIRA